MSKLIFPDFYEMHEELNYKLPSNILDMKNKLKFTNDDSKLNRAAERVFKNRKVYGLEGLVNDLQAIIINTEKENFEESVRELLSTTGYDLEGIYENTEGCKAILKLNNSADIIVTYRNISNRYFLPLSDNIKSKKLPNTRLETLIFETTDIKTYIEIQKKRGVQFLTENLIEKDNYFFIQTIPSSFTGNSIGLIEWKANKGNYQSTCDTPLPILINKPNRSYLMNVKGLDHAATRVKATDRDAALIEFMELTNYNFKFAIYIDYLNSITNVSRLDTGKFAMVFTSGISPYISDDLSGPTEKFVNNYGARVHHLAFITENIEETYDSLKSDGFKFISELVGSEEEGIKQAFSSASPNSLLVNEYIVRYRDFDGFFTKSNVAHLTEASGKQ